MMTSQDSGNDSSSNISTSNSDICRICHCEADTDNPLLSPCYCSGSLKYVHQSCLRQWLAASDTRSCELCKFNFILQTKIKPLSEWRTLEMSNVERRRLLCAILFHFVAAVCVIWSLFVLIDRAAEEVQKGLIAWPFWTKLVVVAVGFTGGAVFMYIQCRQYLHLFARWKAHNRIILVQNAPEKPLMAPPSPEFSYYKRPLHYSPPLPPATTSDQHLCYVFEKESVQHKVNTTSSSSSSRKDDIHMIEDDVCGGTSNVTIEHPTHKSRSRNILALDIESCSSKSADAGSLAGPKPKTDCSDKSVCKSMPNLNTTGDTFIV